MSTPYVAQIQVFAFPFAPENYALCQGQILNIRQYQALFSILTIMYGGDGIQTFGLPDLRGRIPLQFGPLRPQGRMAGEPMHTLSVAEMPAHFHSLLADANPRSGGASVPAGNEALGVTSGVLQPSGTFDVTIYSTGPATGALDPHAIAPAGASQPHNNMMPYTVINYSIALVGTFPTP